MRLVTYEHPDGARPAAVIAATGGDRLLDLSPDGCRGASALVEIIADDAWLGAARKAVERASESPDSLPLLTDVVLLAPVRPGKIICLGYNYRGHVPAGEDPSAQDPQYPDVFVKTPNVLAAPHQPVELPAASSNVDYEGEIALVIGRRAHEVPLGSAMDYVAGYAIFNDVSDRDWQGRSSQWELGKCFDGFGPLGPTIVTKDEVPDPHDLLVEVLREGVVTVSQNTSTMVFSMPFIVHYLSQVMSLEPGDIISTGTPQKLPQALAEHRPLADGDSVTVRVSGLGELTTTFIRPTGLTVADPEIDQTTTKEH